MDRSITSGSRRLAYLEAGPPGGRPLVLLHAFPLAAAMWRPQLDHPPAGWRLLAPDLAGFGASDDRSSESPALEDYAADVVSLLDRLGVDRAVVGGVSLGGYVALALARLHPGRVAGLVLADTKAPADTPEARGNRDRMLSTLADRGVEAVADEMLPKLLGDTTRRERADVVASVRDLAVRNTAGGIAAAIKRLRDRPDARPGLSAIAVPALVIVGDEDTVTPVAEATALRDGIAGSTLEVIAGAGHLSNLEQPTAFNAALARWLESL